jgi:hypothetical protein
MVTTDLGFIAYWSVTAFGLLPPDLAYSDYTDPRVVAWNWSFFPLDIVVSATGLTSLWLLHRRNPAWHGLMVASLSLTAASGLLAISYWVVRSEFDPAWWGPNLFLLLYPVPALVWLLCRMPADAAPSRDGRGACFCGGSHGRPGRARHAPAVGPRTAAERGRVGRG